MPAATRSRRRSSSSRKPGKTRAEYAAERQALSAKLDKFQETLDEQTAEKATSLFIDKYSVNNCLLILMQCPHATQVATYHDWRKAGRQVRRGESGIRLWKYVGGDDKDDASEAAEPGEISSAELRKRPRFQLFSAFDISQTDPIDELSAAITSQAGEPTPDQDGEAEQPSVNGTVDDL